MITINSFETCSTQRSKQTSVNKWITLKHANTDSKFTCTKYERVQIFHSSVREIRVHLRIKSRFQLGPLIWNPSVYHIKRCTKKRIDFFENNKTKSHTSNRGSKCIFYFEIVRKRIIISGDRRDNAFIIFCVTFYCLTFYPKQSLNGNFIS